MPPTPKRLKPLLEDIGMQTWKWLQSSIDLDISLNEESLTDFHLLQLGVFQREGGQGLKAIFKCPKRMEAQIGIDWQWTIGNNRSGWRRYAVQAKKLYHHQTAKPDVVQKYEALTHKNKKGRQIELLLDYAKQNNLIPVYCLYNYVEADSYNEYWHCCRDFKESSQDQQLLGCTVIPADAIQDIWNFVGWQTFDRIHSEQNALPLRCLMCSKLSRQTTAKTSLPQFKGYGSAQKEMPPEVRLLQQIQQIDFAEARDDMDLSEELFERLRADSNISQGIVPKAVVVIEIDDSQIEDAENQ